ncbi:hypothetical protein ACIHFC_25435 [Streptomyces sp. NPDC052013]|uniref:hypothetical protein n=1 Tax=Streptomyces sp. NPDC052013 TaxID=3365679 RepID=UPI0037CD2EA9
MEQPEEMVDDPDAARSSDLPEVVDAVERPAGGKRRRGRTAALIATGAVLGLVAGTCSGYLVQADREPTELPPLSQPVLRQAEGEAPGPLPAAQDRRVRTDGDLRKLLLKKPRGAKESDFLSDDGWWSLDEYAASYTNSDAMFADLVADDLRRVAVTGWEKGDLTVEIRLVQFRQEEGVSAGDYASNNHYWAGQEDVTDSWDIPGALTGEAYVHGPTEEPGYLPYYTAEAHAWRGDISMEIWLSDTKPISKSTVLDLAERQMERL